MAESEKDKRESGQPGGAGRRDEVGGSGVYPMSGPHPKGPAEVRTEAAWGQRERGAAGYEDHGGSELSWDGRELLGGANVGPGGEPLAETEVASRDIDQREWIRFLDSFSRQHQGARSKIEVVEDGVKRVLAEDVTLEGVSADHLNDPDERVYVEFRERDSALADHSIPRPKRIIFVENRLGQPLGLEIHAPDGSRTYVRLQATASPRKAA